MDTGRPKLLLADDSITIQKVVSLTFSDEGMEVITVGDGDEAMRRLEESAPPDIVLADVLMPGLSGYEVCRRVKSDSRLRHIPVVLLVGAFELLNEAEARRAGADEILTKPFQSIRDLVSKVGSLLGGSESKPEAEPEPDGSPWRAEESAAPSASSPAAAHRAATPQSQPIAYSASVPDNFDSGQTTEFAPDPAASFADLVMDDQMIEAKPADAYRSDTSTQPQPEGTSSPAALPADSALDAMSDKMNDEPRAGVVFASGERASDEREFVSAQSVGEEVLAGQHAFASRAASANAADEALLDLGGVNASPGNTAEAEDFILDLEDDLPTSRPAARDDVFDLDAPAYEWPVSAATPRADAAGAFAEAAHGEFTSAPTVFSNAPAEAERSQDEFVPAEVFEDAVVPQHRVPFTMSGEGEATAPAREFIEPTVVPAAESVVAGMVESSYADGSVEGDVARPPVAAQMETQAPHVGIARAGSEQLIGLDQLSPEAVEAIARRAVEMLSERVVQEIAWEVVPQLAELLIKRRLDEESRGQ